MTLPDLPLVVLDTETTGFVPKVHRIMEFASMRVEKGKIVDRYEELISVPEIPPVVSAITRIHPDHLKGKPKFEEKREEIASHIGEDAVLVGQNLGFDIGMLKGEGIDLTERPWIDTSMLASLAFPELPSYSLGYLSTALKLNHTPKHRAMGDVVATLELLGKVWERLLELPEAQLKTMREIFAKSSPGYKLLFDALPKSKAKSIPSWMEAPGKKRNMRAPKDAGLEIPKQSKGELIILEEPLDPLFIGSVITAARKDATHTHWIAVKNLDALLSRVTIGAEDKDLRIAFAPHQLLDPDAAKRLFAQDAFTPEEATVAVKIDWFQPRARRDIALHGGEEAVWNGKLAATMDSEVYRAQFEKPAGTLLMDHRELLSIVTDEKHPGHGSLEKKAQVIIDDASMLEDTATKAYGWECKIQDLRAAAAGNAALTQLTDVLSLWIEKIRQFQSIRYIVSPDLTSPDTKGLRTLIEAALKDTTVTPQVTKALTDLQKILTLENLTHRITWIEQWQDGSLVLSSVPERIGLLLEKDLLSKAGTMMLVPKGCGALLPEILPPGFIPKPEEILKPQIEVSAMSLAFDPTKTLDDIMKNPPAGKTVVLIPSKGMMEDLYVKYCEDLEARGVTIICQGVSGGQGRMQAEFEGATAPALWLLTPWSFEGMDLPDGTVDHMFIKALPFDHPSNTILSHRAQHFGNAFEQYLMPRLLHRLFRLLRTYARFRKPAGDVLVMDDRIFSKAYGKVIKAYMESITQASVNTATTEKAVPAKKAAPKKKATKAAKSTNQLPLL